MLAAIPTAVTTPSPMPPARASLASDPSRTTPAMRTADARDQQPGGRAHERVQPLRDHEHARALLALGGARHRADGGARHAVAQHQQIAGERRHQPVRAQLGHLEAAGQERHDHEQRQQAGRLGDLLEQRAGRDQPRLAWATHAGHDTHRIGRPLGWGLHFPTAPMTRPQPQPAAAASAPAVAADIPKREILGVPVAMTDYQGAVEALDAMVDSRERGYVCAVSVHSLTSALDDPEMAAVFRGATLVLPDGMPVVWAANLLGAASRGASTDRS